MKYVKENMTLVICGAVIVLTLVFALAPGIPYMAPALSDTIRDDLKERIAKRTAIQQLSVMRLELPNHADGKGPPTDEWIKAKHESSDKIQAERQKVETAMRQWNATNRFDGRAPLLPVPSPTDATRTTFQAMAGYLPNARADRMAFKDHLIAAYRRWTGLLAKGTGDLNTDATVPPNVEDIRAANPVAAGAVGGGGGQSAEFRKIERQAVVARASELRMYVEASAFQKRQWLVGIDAPGEQDIFTGFVDMWCQSDVVDAIRSINDEALRAVPQAKDRNVSRAPIKRLTRMVVGVNARSRQGSIGPTAGGAVGGGGGPVSDPGAVFLTSSNAGGTAGSGISPMTPVPVNSRGGPQTAPQDAPAPSNEIRYDLSLTGRSAGNDYDIVPMSVVMDMDPSYLNRFIEQLYRNMSYTVINVQFRTIDPLDRGSAGYLYGDGQVIEVELQIEGIFFRSWTQPLMPKEIKQILGIAPKA